MKLPIGTPVQFVPYDDNEVRAALITAWDTRSGNVSLVVFLPQYSIFEHDVPYSPRPREGFWNPIS